MNCTKKYNAVAGLFVSVMLFGCGGGGGGGDGGSTAPREVSASVPLAGICAAPRSGVDAYNNNQPYPDVQGTIENEKSWLSEYMHKSYLWYREIPNADASQYTTGRYGSVANAMDAYFQALKTQSLTPSGKLKDQFSFTYDTAAWEALSQNNAGIGYGIEYASLSISPPRNYLIAYTNPGTPAAHLTRGTQILAVDGVDLINSSEIDKLSAGLFPKNVGEQHTLTILDPGTSVSRDVRLTAAVVTSTPVQNVKTFDTTAGRVGYMLFNDHLATAEGQLVNAVDTLHTAGITDLILDIRYNSGGYLDIASELAYMIAGPVVTNGKTFERPIFNDKTPLASSIFSVIPFLSTTQGLDSTVPSNQALPHLGLTRVFMITGPNTCSASEAIINGLRGIGVQVVLIGETTCGKPYGFFPKDNCGTTYFAIESQGLNDQGFGDYAEGFTPTCNVADDFSHELGDESEGRLAAALAYQKSGSCSARTLRAESTRTSNAKVQMFKSPLRTNRFIRAGSH
ncbi:MAG: S41 family peptidase [Pseudomonadota bacterium]